MSLTGIFLSSTPLFSQLVDTNVLGGPPYRKPSADFGVKRAMKSPETHDTDDEIRLRRYLLGETEPQERGAIEQRLLRDRRYFNELQRLEEALTDEYARGEMGPAQREQFELYFLNSPERLENLQFSEAFGKYRAAQREKDLTLTPQLDRNAVRPSVVVLSASTRLLRLALAIESGECRRYRAEIQTVEGQVVWGHDDLKPQPPQLGEVALILLPTALLTCHDYLVVLSAATSSETFEPAGTYYFSVTRK
jgi:hypothetical protein